MFSEKLKKWLATIAITGIITAGTTACDNLNISRYASTDQMNTMAQALGVDMNHMMDYHGRTGYARLLANDGPVFVTIDQKLEDDKGEIVQALDTIFNLIHRFNPAYTYKIVDADEKIAPDASSIHFKEQPITEEYTLAYVTNTTIPTRTLLNNNVYLQKVDIVIDLDEIKNSKGSVFSASLHELGHVFGLGDVYRDGVNKTTDKYVANTLMHVYLGYKLPMFTLYDVARFAVLYTPQAKNKKDLNDKIESVREILEDYHADYYQYYTTKVKDCINTAAGRTFTFGDIAEDDTFVFETSVKIVDEGVEYGYSYKIECHGETYSLEIFDHLGNLLDQCAGDILIENGIMVLKDVELRGGLRPEDRVLVTPEGYIQDLTLFRVGDGVHMYDVADNNVMYGTVDYLENDLSLD